MPNIKIEDEQIITRLYRLRDRMEQQAGRRLYWRDVIAILMRIYETTAPKTLPTLTELYDTPARANAYKEKL